MLKYNSILSSIIIIVVLIVGTSLAFLHAFYPEIVLGWYEGQKMHLPKKLNIIMFRIFGTIIFVVFLGVLILAIMSLFIP